MPRSDRARFPVVCFRMDNVELLKQLEEARAELEALRSKVEDVKKCLTSQKFWEGRTWDGVEVADYVLVRLQVGMLDLD